jgi:hypothetical protein
MSPQMSGLFHQVDQTSAVQQQRSQRSFNECIGLLSLTEPRLSDSLNRDHFAQIHIVTKSVLGLDLH